MYCRSSKLFNDSGCGWQNVSFFKLLKNCSCYNIWLFKEIPIIKDLTYINTTEYVDYNLKYDLSSNR
jgi:hypothetical protein